MVLAIHLSVDAEAQTITIADSGIGMNREELAENLGTIAHSGARTFLQNVGAGENALEEIIGQFGVGFYSALAGGQRTVTRRAVPARDQAWTWRCRGQPLYAGAGAGQGRLRTTVTIKLEAEALPSLPMPGGWSRSSRSILDYVSFPIYLAGEDGEEKVINRFMALWRQSPGKASGRRSTPVLPPVDL